MHREGLPAGKIGACGGLTGRHGAKPAIGANYRNLDRRRGKFRREPRQLWKFESFALLRFDTALHEVHGICGATQNMPDLLLEGARKVRGIGLGVIERGLAQVEGDHGDDEGDA